jgi:hypothetical protein
VDESSEEGEERDVAVRDRQLRGYGIGGVGNIREFNCNVRFVQC